MPQLVNYCFCCDKIENLLGGWHKPSSPAKEIIRQAEMNKNNGAAASIKVHFMQCPSCEQISKLAAEKFSPCGCDVGVF